MVAIQSHKAVAGHYMTGANQIHTTASSAISITTLFISARCGPGASSTFS
jgi:hypothetical protein